MPLSLIEKEVDIRQYPRCEDNVNSLGKKVAIGDLHGNALKLLYFLVEQRVVKISEQDFNDFVRIYLIAENVYNVKFEHIDSFLSILSNISVFPINKILLIGDVVCDRGANDFFTLKFLEKIIIDGVNVEILISNHDVDFIEICEKDKTFDCFRLQPIHAMSMQDLEILIKNKLIERKEILSIFENYYKNCLKPISYQLHSENNEIMIYSHAAIDLTIIKAMADKVSVQYKDESPQALAGSIDAINLEFEKQYITKKVIHTLFDPKEMWKGYENDQINGEEFPYVFAIWNRNYSELKRPKLHNGYDVYYCHGHDLGEKSTNNIINLDSMLGKLRGSYYEGLYKIMYF